MYQLQILDPSGTYFPGMCHEDLAYLRAEGRAWVRLVGAAGFRIVRLDRAKPLPLKPPRPPGLSGAGEPRRGTFAPSQAKPLWS